MHSLQLDEINMLNCYVRMENIEIKDLDNNKFIKKTNICKYSYSVFFTEIDEMRLEGTIKQVCGKAKIIYVAENL